MLLSLILAQAMVTGDGPSGLYQRTVAVMRSIGEPEYLAFQVDHSIASSYNSSNRSTIDLERTSDGATFARLADKADGKLKNAESSLGPDLFLHPDWARAEALPSGLDPSNGAYSVVRAADASGIAGCTDTIHLVLQPLTDAKRHSLRELWIDSQTFHICRAVEAWHGRADFRTTIDVSPAGYITVLHTDPYSYRTWISSIRMTEQETFSNVHPVDASAWPEVTASPSRP